MWDGCFGCFVVKVFWFSYGWVGFKRVLVGVDVDWQIRQMDFCVFFYIVEKIVVIKCWFVVGFYFYIV